MNLLWLRKKERKKTLQDISKMINTSFVNLARYERGTRTIPLDLIKDLSVVYEVTSDFLLGISNFGIYASFFDFDIPISFVFSKEVYDELERKDAIYFLDDKRYIDLNKYFNTKSKNISKIIHQNYKDESQIEPFILTRTILFNIEREVHLDER